MATPTEIAGYLLLFILVGMLFVLVNLFLGKFLRPSSPNREKLEIYECGEPSIGSGFVQFDLRFYVVALVFIVFDVEIAFLFPWAKVYQAFISEGNGGIALFEGLIFIVILFIGLVYVWAKGDLEWVKALKPRKPREEG